MCLSYTVHLYLVFYFEIWVSWVVKFLVNRCEVVVACWTFAMIWFVYSIVVFSNELARKLICGRQRNRKQIRALKSAFVSMWLIGESKEKSLRSALGSCYKIMFLTTVKRFLKFPMKWSLNVSTIYLSTSICAFYFLNYLYCLQRSSSPYKLAKLTKNNYGYFVLPVSHSVVFAMFSCFKVYYF